MDLTFEDTEEGEQEEAEFPDEPTEDELEDLFVPDDEEEQDKTEKSKDKSEGQSLLEDMLDALPDIDGATIETFGGVPMIIHDDSEVAKTGSGMWVISMPEGCRTNHVRALMQDMPMGATSQFGGNPDQGGLCVLIMNGTKQQVTQEISGHNWPSAPIVETDKVWGAIPDMPAEANSPPDGAVAANSTIVDNSFMPNAQQKPPWGLDRIDQRKGMDESYSPRTAYKDGEGVHVFVADTGIMTEHRDFGGRAIPTLEVLSFTSPRVCNRNDVNCARDMGGHGTHTAGIIAGTQYGVAKKAVVHAVKVLSDSGVGSFSWFIGALDWVLQATQDANMKPAVFSASLGARAVIASVKVAIDKAVAGGVTVVVAAGNEGSTDCPDACKHSPAFVGSAITVAATANTDTRSWYSNEGECVDIFAPGTYIESAQHDSNTGSRHMSGTSMACPHVAGMAALLLGEDTSRGPDDVLQIMMERGTIGKLSDVKDAPNALVYAGPDDSPPPMTQPSPSPTPPPASPPPVVYMCSFEQRRAFDGPCFMWSNIGRGDKFNWRRGTNRRNHLPGTGPNKAFHGKSYLYIKARQRNLKPGDYGMIRSRKLTVGPEGSLTFNYNMHGRDMGRLLVRVNGKNVFVKNGNKGSPWRLATIDLSGYSGQTIRIVIMARRGKGVLSDMAIDSVVLRDTVVG